MSQEHSSRNLVLFAGIVGMQYLAAPVIYVGITQASLLSALGANATISNLPGASFFVMATLVALVAWAFPQVRYLKRILVICYATAAVTSGLTAAALTLPLSNDLKIVAVILQSGLTGATIPTAIAFIWEVLGRTTDSKQRGVALGLAYGLGPVLAAVGSLGSQLILAGSFEIGPYAWSTSQFESPHNFALLFALETPAMMVAALLASRFRIPIPEHDVDRRPVTDVLDLILGIAASVAAMVLTLNDRVGWSIPLMLLASVLFAIHFRDLLSVRLLLLVTIATAIFYVGNVIPSNMNLYSKEVLGVDPQSAAGYQNLMRFSFKALAGLGLGWLLVRTNPRTGVLVTASLYVAALLWAMFASGRWFLLAFGIFGAGELVGVYAPNYMLSACRKSEMKRGQVLMNLLMGPVGQLGVLFGWIADAVARTDVVAWGQTSRALGFQLSFAVCAVVLLCGIAFTVVFLPPHPVPAEGREEATDDSDAE